MQLRSRTIFADYDFLSIQSHSRKFMISCGCKDRKDNIGLSFVRVSNLTLSYVRVTECCGAISIYTSAILIQQCSNITIDRLQLNNNRFGNALTLINPLGYVNM